MTVPVLQVDGLTVALPRGADRREAVSGVSFEIPPGQVVCLVGESGSGKSIIAHTVMGLAPRNIRATAGEVRLYGEALLHAAPERLRQRGPKARVFYRYARLPRVARHCLPATRFQAWTKASTYCPGDVH